LLAAQISTFCVLARRGLFTVRAAGGMSCCLVFGFDALLAKQATQPFHVAAEALDLLCQGR